MLTVITKRTESSKKPLSLPVVDRDDVNVKEKVRKRKREKIIGLRVGY
jgi:hypothetical protein